MAHRSGFVCLAGQPNVGKSTLLNRLVGKDISITADKPQTTRTRILGVQHGEDVQVVFIDTPGIHDASDAFSSRLVAYTRAALRDVDMVLVLLSPPFAPNQAAAAQEAEQAMLTTVFGNASGTEGNTGLPVVLVLNKVDLVPEADILAAIAAYSQVGSFREIVPISAKTGRNVAHLADLIQAAMPEGPQYFEPGQTTDQTEGQVIGELVRQEVFRRTHQEVPYSTAVRVDHLEERGETLHVTASIVVERDSQKGLVIGQGGKRLKSIGSAARRQIESLLGVHVYLDLHVRVVKNWSRDTRRIAELGYPEPE